MIVHRRATKGVIALVVVAFAAVVVVRTLRERATDKAAERCALALKAARQTAEPYEGGAMIADACGALYAEAGCRDAYTRAWAKDADPSQRMRIAGEGCRDAYCPKLPAPKPALCAQPEVNLITARTTWPEFTRVILVRDLGEERVERLRVAMEAASP